MSAEVLRRQKFYSDLTITSKTAKSSEELRRVVESAFQKYLEDNGQYCLGYVYKQITDQPTQALVSALLFKL